MAPAMITKNQVWRCYKIKSDLNKKFLKFWLTAHLYRKWRNFLNDHNVKCLYVFICCHIRLIDQSIHVSRTCYILPLLISLRCILYFLGSTIFKFSERQITNDIFFKPMICEYLQINKCFCELRWKHNKQNTFFSCQIIPNGKNSN